MNHRLVLIGLLITLAVSLCGTPMSAASDWSIPVSGPDGKVTVDKGTIDGMGSEFGVLVQINGENKTGIPLWRILRLADIKKTLGPGDTIEVTGDNSMKVPYQRAYKNDAYLLVDTDNVPSLYISPDAQDSLVSRVQTIGISTTDDWAITLTSTDLKKEVTKKIWNDLTAKSRKEITDYEGRIFSGIPIFKLIESQGISPDAGSQVKITAQDLYSVEIPWAEISGNAGYLLADKMNNEIISKSINIGAEYGDTPAWPLMLIDPEFPGNYSVGNVAELQILK